MTRERGCLTRASLALANGRSEALVMDRTGHRASLMVARHKRQARTAAEFGLGPLAPLDQAIPEFVAAGKLQGHRARRRRQRKLSKKTNDWPLGGMVYAGDLKSLARK